MSDKIIKVGCCKYMIDWNHEYETEFNLDIHPFFDVEYRLGDWFIIPFKKLEKSPWFEEDYIKSHELARPIKTIANIQPYIRGYRWLHRGESDLFANIMIKLMADVSEYKKRGKL